MKDQICAVVVTYNRKELLMECLDALKKQTYSLDGIYIIDNASTDNTPNLLFENKYILELPPSELNVPWQKDFVLTNQNTKIKIHYVRMDKNTGGSGGFYEGIKRAYENGYDWIWVMDDDATPKLNALEELLKFKDDSLAALTSVVLKRNTGEIDLGHRRIFNKISLKEQPVNIEKYKEKYFYFNEFSYVGTLINSRAIKSYGFTDKSFFILYDDTEHSLRLSQYGKMICVTSSQILHGPKLETKVNKGIDYKAYYGIRNRISVLKKYGNKFTFFFYIEYFKLRNYAAKILKRRNEIISLILSPSCSYP